MRVFMTSLYDDKNRYDAESVRDLKNFEQFKLTNKMQSYVIGCDLLSYASSARLVFACFI